MTVRDLNIKIQSFPARVVAGFGNFQKREFFELEEPSDREVPVVSFGATTPTPPGTPP